MVQSRRSHRQQTTLENETTRVKGTNQDQITGRPPRSYKPDKRIAASTAVSLARDYFRGKAGIVIGSVARGDNVASSDLDLLILTTSKARLATYYSIPSVAEARPLVSIITYTPKDFAKFWDEGSLFVYHVLTEGLVAWDDGTFRRLLKHPFKLKSDFSADITTQLERLKLFSEPRAFGDLFVYAFVELFKIYKNIVFFALAHNGHPEFNKRRAFRNFYRLKPGLVRYQPLLNRLERYYMASVRGKGSAPTLDSATLSEELVAMVRVLSELGEAVR